MNSDQLNWWLTVGANVGVLVGLIFVGLEVRNSTDAVSAQTADSVADGYNTVNLAAIADPAMARLLHVGIEHPERLTDLEAYRFSLLIRSYFNQYHRVHRLYQLGLVSEEEWAEYAVEIGGFMSTPGVTLFVEGNPLPEDFLSDVSQSQGAPHARDYSLGRGSLEIP